MSCLGDRSDHCCYLGDGVCPFLEQNVDGRRWACGLRRELGSFQAVHTDERYVAYVRPRLDNIGIAVDCGDWPTPGETCATCGVTGDG